MVALAWGAVATWWFGIILGATLALAATLGRRPIAPWRWIIGATAFVFGVTALSAEIAYGITRGFALKMPDVFGEVYARLSHAQRLAFTQVAAAWIVWRRRAFPK